MKKGFTLIELLVVVLIIGILSAVALPRYQVAVLAARVKRHLPTIRSILNAEEVYYIATNSYTCDLDKLDLDIAYLEKIEKPELSGSCNGESGWRYILNAQQDRVYFVGDRAWYSIPETLTVDVFNDGSMKCYGEGEQAALGERVCKSMGTKVNGTHYYLLN